MYTLAAAIQKSHPPHEMVFIECPHRLPVTPLELIELLGYVQTQPEKVRVAEEGLMTVVQAQEIRRALINGGGRKMGTQRKDIVKDRLDQVITCAQQNYSAVGWRTYNDSDG